MKAYIIPIIQLTRYNIKIIFGNKFIYFVLSAIGFYILMVALNIFSDDEITAATAYQILLVPSILLIFYPTCFGVQNDQDNKIIEVIFGIPNYRYKVWMFRLLIAYVIVVEVPPFELTYQVMAPALFTGMLCFMLSTIIRNGNGTAVLVIILGFSLMILGQILRTSMWNLFLNPFNVPVNSNEQIFYDTIFDNRLLILFVSLIFLLVGLTKMQNREKFM